MEKGCPKRNYLVCISIFAAVNLAVMVIAAQFSIPLLGFDSLVKDLDAQTTTIKGADAAGCYRFQSCTGGDSVNCHTPGNHAGL